MQLTLFLAFAFASLTAANQLRGAMSPPQITPGFPVFAALRHRQAETCLGAATLCADGNGCCSIGDACGYTTTQGQVYGICEGTCKLGVATCTTPIKACCQTVGDLCGADGTCTAPSGGGGPSTLPITGTTSYSLPPITITTTTPTSFYVPSLTTSNLFSFTTPTTSTSAAGLDTTSDTSIETSSVFGGGGGSSDTTTSAPVTVTVTPTTSGNAGNMLRGVDNNVLLGLPLLAGYLFGDH